MRDDAAVVRTFLFSEIEGSARVWECSPSLMAAALMQFDELVVEAIERSRGTAAKHRGDRVSGVFDVSSSALRAAVDVQRAMSAAVWPTDQPLRARVGLHRGETTRHGADYSGLTVAAAARIASVSSGGQILLSLSVKDDLHAEVDARFRDEGRCWLEALDVPLELYTAVVEGLPQMFDAVPRASRATAGRPIRSADFVGRSRELGDAAALLAQHRLVTMTGPPGTGKTRLAIEVATDAVPCFSGRVRVVELTRCNDCDEVARAVADALLGSDAMAGSGSMIDRLNAAITEPTLVVLDGCEHAIDEVAAFVRMFLSRVLPARCLLTSRQPLGVLGEQEMKVEPLETYGADGSAPAQQLFLQRARQVDSDLRALDPELVEEVCVRLDGLPLAIELAAARLDDLSLEELNGRLFEVITGPSEHPPQRDGAPTLHPALAWSWGLLSDDEKVVLARASVFVGSFDFEAACDVCGGADLPAVAVVGLIAALEDRSFLAPVRNEGGDRFRMLEVIRAFVTARADPGDIELANRRHQDHYLRVTAPLTVAFDEKPDALLTSRLELDDRNFTAALAVRPGASPESARKLAIQLHTYWEETGRLSDGLRCVRALLEPRELDSALWHAMLGLSVSYAAMTGQLSEMAESEALLGELVGGAPNPRSLNAYFALGFASLGRAKLLEAATWFETAAGVASDRHVQRQALMTAGVCWAYDDSPGRALELYARARRVPPPRQAWFDDYVTVFECSAHVQTGSRATIDWACGSIDRALSSLVEMRLGFRVTVAVHQAIVAFECVDAADLLEYWWPVCLRNARENGHRWAAALAVEVAGWASARARHDEQALQHWAVADRVFASAGFVLPRVHSDRSEHHRAAVRARVGDDVFDAQLTRAGSIDLATHIDHLLGRAGSR